MKLQQSTSPQREWGIRRFLLPLFVCMLAMVAVQGRAQDVTAEDVRQWHLFAEQGDAEAQLALGSFYYFGKGVTKDYVEAMKWFRKAAEQGLADAQFILGGFYYYEDGVKQDYAEAARWWRKAAEQGHAEAQYELGCCYEVGEGVAQNYYEAVKWWRKAAKQGHADAQFNLGVSYYNGEGVAQNYYEAARWWRKAAEQGHAEAQYELGCCYEIGCGVEQNYDEALKWYGKAAEQGHEDAEDAMLDLELILIFIGGQSGGTVNGNKKATEQGNADEQYNLGNKYYKGEGVTKDYAEAVRWYLKAAVQGHAEAQYRLGGCCYSGTGVTVDYAEAVKWYRKAAEQGHVTAQKVLGTCYYLGDGVKQDYAEAARWWRKAAERGDAHAQYDLGNCYAKGHGVKQNYDEALKWYRKAAEQGHKDAEKAMLRLEPSIMLTGDQSERKSDTGMVNGHEWVDLGLSVKWATCNVGASSPSECGNYYAWGETSTKSGTDPFEDYIFEDYKYYKDGKYKRIGKNISGKQYDAARANWGGTWRMPTLEEAEELCKKCTWTWTTQDGHKGYRVTGPNGKSIFLPAAGFRWNGGRLLQGTYGFYWTATFCPFEDNSFSHSIKFHKGEYYCEGLCRCEGRPIRAVTD